MVSQANEFEVLRYQEGRFSWDRDLVAEERRVDIFVNGQVYVSVVATPRQLDDLAFGYLFSEGVINGPPDIRKISVDGLNVYVETTKEIPAPPARARSCGFGLGSVVLQDLQVRPGALPRVNPPLLSAAEVVELMEEFNQLSELFRLTGAVHSAWLVDGGSKFFAEDVGRHNALDKVIGRRLAASSGLERPGLLFTTGRVSVEMLLKTARAGLGALISRGAASALAVDLAEELNIILVGFARGERFKAFHGGEFILEAIHA